MVGLPHRAGIRSIPVRMIVMNLRLRKLKNG